MVPTFYMGNYREEAKDQNIFMATDKTWMLFEAHEHGCGDSEMLSKIPILYGTILLNAPELMITGRQKVERWIQSCVAGNCARYGMFELDNDDENWTKLKELRKQPGFGDPTIIAISKDDVASLATLFATPHFDRNQEILGKTLLQHAIDWEAIECFNFLLLNGATRRGCLDVAIEEGRIEMIELLLEAGEHLSLESIESALRGFQVDVRDWLMEYHFDDIFPEVSKKSK